MVDVARICVPLHQGGVSVLKGQFTEALVGALLRNLRHLQSSHNQCVRTCAGERTTSTNANIVLHIYFTDKFSRLCLSLACVKVIIRINFLGHLVLENLFTRLSLILLMTYFALKKSKIRFKINMMSSPEKPLFAALKFCFTFPPHAFKTFSKRIVLLLRQTSFFQPRVKCVLKTAQT